VVDMKKISIVVPCYNEEANVSLMYEAIVNLFKNELKKYKYEILFIDNKSKDNTRYEIRQICKKDKNVLAIFNIKNFGQFNSPYYALLQTSGDCTISIAADFQEPVELIPEFVKYWEQGYKIVCGVKSKSEEPEIIYELRKLGYKVIRKLSEVDHIENFTGFGLYDKEFINILKDLKEPLPYFRGMVAELGYNIKTVEFKQKRRKHGISSNNVMSILDAGMIGLTTYAKKEMHIAALFGLGISFLSIFIAFIYFLYKLLHWYTFDAGVAPIVIGIFFLGGIQIFLISLIGEYIINMNQRIINRPLVIEEERINFSRKNSKKTK
jgi:glycosyltransferase involved in cell wall biosynthesis